MSYPILYSFIRCPYAMRARMAIKLCDIKCEIREVRLYNKPDQMIKQSPKGTVPVLVLKNKVIDESNEIIDWALSKNNVFDGNLDKLNTDLTNELIKLFPNDNQDFKVFKTGANLLRRTSGDKIVNKKFTLLK